MKVKKATISDVEMIHFLINLYAEQDQMLFRSHAEIYENLQIFWVAKADGAIVGCCALQVFWSDLAEVQSLAVAQEFTGKGIGKALTQAALNEAKGLGIPKIMILTLKPDFFKKLGFKKIEKKSLPMKVWSDCTKCSKQDHCDEVALIYEF